MPQATERLNQNDTCPLSLLCLLTCTTATAGVYVNPQAPKEQDLALEGRHPEGTGWCKIPVYTPACISLKYNCLPHSCTNNSSAVRQSIGGIHMWVLLDLQIGCGECAQHGQQKQLLLQIRDILNAV